MTIHKRVFSSDVIHDSTTHIMQYCVFIYDMTHFLTHASPYIQGYKGTKYIYRHRERINIFITAHPSMTTPNALNHTAKITMSMTFFSLFKFYIHSTSTHIRCELLYQTHFINLTVTLFDVQSVLALCMIAGKMIKSIWGWILFNLKYFVKYLYGINYKCIDNCKCMKL